MPIQKAFLGKGEEREGQCEKLTKSDLCCACAVNLEDTKSLPSQQKNDTVPHCKMDQRLIFQAACFAGEFNYPVYDNFFLVFCNCKETPNQNSLFSLFW